MLRWRKRERAIRPVATRQVVDMETYCLLRSLEVFTPSTHDSAGLSPNTIKLYIKSDLGRGIVQPA